MTAQVWSNVAVAMESAAATPVAITGITKADPAVVAHSGADPTVGNYVVLIVEGMTEVNARVFRVATVSAGVSFELEGEDSTLYGTFGSGTFSELTFGTSLGTVRGVAVSGGEFDFVDTTTIHDKIMTQLPSIASALEFALENRWEPGNAALIAMRAASDAKAQKGFIFTFSTGALVVFYGYVGFVFAPGGSAQDLVTSPATITASGLNTNYAS
jgi:hypothetical protein